MNEMLNSIKIRKLILVCIVVTVGLVLISELPIIKKNTAFDMNFWLLINDLAFLMWFVFKIVRRKISIKPLIDDFKANINWIKLFKIVFTNMILSFGFIMCVCYIVYKINPDFVSKLLSESDSGTNGSFISAVMSAVTATFIAPIIEEFMFRGVMLNRLKIRWGITPAIIVSSFLFALLHYQVAFFGAFFFGIIMCLLYLKSGNILINICAHFINNLLVSLITIITYSPVSSSSNLSFKVAEINLMGITGIVMLIISGYFTIKFITKNYKCHKSLEC